MFANDVSLSFHFRHSYCVEAKNHSLRSWLFASRIVCLDIEKGAIHILRFTKLISHIAFYIYFVNCAFLAAADYVLAASF